MRNRMMCVAVVAGVLLVAACSDDGKSSSTTAGGGTPVNVTALDKSATAEFTLDRTSVKAGPVTFTFVNNGNRQHEMIILKTDEAFDALVVGADHKVGEDTSVGEISETDAGKTVVSSFDLAAGNYVLVCDIALHYEQGMRVAFTVTP